MTPFVKTFHHTHYPQNGLNLYKKRGKLFIFLKRTAVLNTILLVLIIFSTILYLFQINKLTVYGFKIKELENKKNDLNQSFQELELKKLRLESINNLQNDFRKIGLVKTETVEYLRPFRPLTGTIVVSSLEDKLK